MASYEAAINRLEQQVNEYRIEYERFFNGATNLPPAELRDEIRRRLRHLHASNIQSPAEQFRLNGIEARFNSLDEHYGRRQRADERRQRTPSPTTTSRTNLLDTERGVRVSSGSEQLKAEALYKALYGTSGRGGGLEKFQSYLDRQIDALRSQSGCREIRFRVVDEDGKRKLKAKPITD